jgi:flagellar hook protein FlgE
MLQSFFNGLSGMITFSSGLDTISNNIANMNTPGFRGMDMFYKALSSGGSHAGVRSGEYSLNTTAGEIRQTGRATDLAIIGNGYFILRNEGQAYYTRSGQFQFDPDGFLVDSQTGYRVAAIDESGNLVDINIENLRQLNPEPTTQINFNGNLSTGSTSGQTEVSVFNSLGEEITLDIEFTNNTSNTAGSWLISIKDEDGTEISTGEIRFAPDGSPLSGFNTVNVSLPASSNGTANIGLDLQLYFGEEGSFSDTTSFSGGTTSTISSSIEDGRGVEGLIAVSFNENGELNLLYSNGDTESPFTVALAYFNDENALQYVEGSIYEAPSNLNSTIGQANKNVFGSIVGESIESSNVDLVREFAEMIIIQRGYQASSRAMNVANQLVEQLYENTRG